MEQSNTGGHAIVLGASVAGLLTARVLTKCYRRVTLVDRDVLPGGGVHRRGVPHGRCTPAHSRAAVLIAVEGGRHMLTAAGMLGDHPPTDPTGFDAFVADLLFPDTTLGDAFLRVAGLVESPQALLRPDRALRVLRSTLRSSVRRASATSAAVPWVSSA